MTVNVGSLDALADCLEYLARELRRGTVKSVSIATMGSQARVAVEFSTTQVPTWPGVDDDETDPTLDIRPPDKKSPDSG